MNDSQSHFLKYLMGFILSLVLTTAAYIAVQRHIAADRQAFSYNILISIIIGLALVQLIVQLYFFLHLGQESKPHWNLMSFLLTVPVIVIIVFGSLWIMYHLNYRHVMPADINTYIFEEEGIRR